MRRRSACGATAVLAGLTALPAGAVPAVGMVRAEIAPPYFGMHFHRLVRKPGEPAPTPWPEQAGIGSVRLWDSETRWADVAPHPRRWDFDRMDAYVSRASRQGASVLYTLGSTPRWASIRPDEPGPYGPGCAAEPRDMADWVEYLRRVVGRYRGAIQAYELWNEPNFSDIPRDRGAQAFYTGSVAAMVAMARSARTVIDEVDPKALLATPGFVNGPDRLDLFLARGGAGLVDAVAYHFYSNGTPRFAGQLDEVRQVMRRREVAALPLWNTECGVETVAAQDARAAGEPGALGEADAAARMAQFLLLGAAGGIDRFYYYAWDNGRTGMIDALGRTRPRLLAFAQVRAWLLGTRPDMRESLPGGGVLLAGGRAEERLVFAWAERSRLHRLPIPRGWQAASVERLLEARTELAPSGDSTVALALTPHPLQLRLIRPA